MTENKIPDLEFERSLDEMVRDRVRHYHFPLHYYWVYKQIKDKAVVYPSDMSKKFKITNARSNQVLSHWAAVGLLKKADAGGYEFMKNDHKPVMDKYLADVIKILQDRGLLRRI